jgi:hypothetical protein
VREARPIFLEHPRYANPNLHSSTIDEFRARQPAGATVPAARPIRTAPAAIASAEHTALRTHQWDLGMPVPGVRQWCLRFRVNPGEDRALIDETLAPTGSRITRCAQPAWSPSCSPPVMALIPPRSAIAGSP